MHSNATQKSVYDISSRSLSVDIYKSNGALTGTNQRLSRSTKLKKEVESRIRKKLTKKNTTGQNVTILDKTEHYRAERNNSGQNRTLQDKARYERHSRISHPGHDKTSLDRAKQDRAGHYRSSFATFWIFKTSTFLETRIQTLITQLFLIFFYIDR